MTGLRSERSAHIRWVVIRFDYADSAASYLGVDSEDLAQYLVRGQEGIAEIDEYLSRFPHLQKVVVETKDLTEYGNHTARSLQKVGPRRVLQRTCFDAREAAIRGAHSLPEHDKVPYSPFWSMKRHKWEWEEW